MAKRNDTSGKQRTKRKSAPTPRDLLNRMETHLAIVGQQAQSIERAYTETMPFLIKVYAFEIQERSSVIRQALRKLRRQLQQKSSA